MLIIIWLISLIIIGGMGVGSIVEKKTKHFLVGFLVYMVYMILMCLCILNITESTYKDGQVDAINGIISYELVEAEDGTRSWEEIKEEKDGE